jgi:tRNA-specific 2-thiouridylase
MKQKVAIGLSGGVDSSVAAALLVERGYDVTGVYITCWPSSAQGYGGGTTSSGCRAEEDRKDALDIAMQLHIPFVHLDYQKEYKEKVYEYMISEYEVGRTPNPDVVCNREIKFGMFYDWVMNKGFDYVATGHYAQIGWGDKDFNFCSAPPPRRGGSVRKNENYCLLRSVDEHKDQTYFLYQLREEQLEHILFPIGHLMKSEVRVEAEKRGLLTAKKADSVGICFIGEKPMDEFLQERIKPRTGNILLGNDVVGTHKGMYFYTIGQKIGLDQTKIKGFDPKNLPHFYVIDKDIEKNILYVGTDDKLFKDEMILGDVRSINDKLQITNIKSNSNDKNQNLYLRIRHTGELIPIRELRPALPAGRFKNKDLRIKLAKPVRAVAPGQVGVLYQGDICLGGGTIISCPKSD